MFLSSPLQKVFTMVIKPEPIPSTVLSVSSSSSKARDPELLRDRLAEVMASRGVGYNQIAQEILYLLPREFTDKYEQLFWAALQGGELGSSSDQLSGMGELGKASGALKKGGKREGGAEVQVAHVQGGGGKKFRRAWVIADEDALNFKSKVDKRLRAIARDIRLELSGAEGSEVGDRARKAGAGVTVTRCSMCGKIGNDSWAFCPHDGKVMVKIKSDTDPK